MLAVWLHGSEHAGPMTFSQMVGLDDSLGWRYNLHEVSPPSTKKIFRYPDLPVLENNLTAGRIYHLAICYENTFFHYETVLRRARGRPHHARRADGEVEKG